MYKLTIAAGLALAHLAAAPALATDTLQEQVIVTASRVPESGLPQALSWSAASDTEIGLTGAVHINELMQRIPGAWISRGNGQESLPALRSPVLTGAGGCGAFYMAADGIALRAPGFCNVNQLFDANSEQAGRIEVIRGPGTSIYGSNALHGVINVLSAAPTSEPDQYLSLEAGPYDYYRGRYHYRASHGAHGLSLNANGSSDGGYKQDSGYDQQKATLRHDYSGADWDTVSTLDYANLNQETAGFIEGYKAYQDDDLKDTNPNPEAFRDARALRLYNRASRDLGSHSRLVITPYLRSNEMQFLMHFLPWQPLEENGHDSLGLQAAIHTERDQWQLAFGTDIDYTDGWLKETQARPFSPNQPAGVHYDYQVDALSAALFGQGGWRSGALELTAGLRFEHNAYDYDNRTGDGPACGPEASACRFYRPADREDSFDNLSLHAGASFALSDSLVAWSRIASGFRAPQAAELYRLQDGQAVADLDSEEMLSLELGLRGEGDRLGWSASMYWMEKDEVIFQDADRQNVSGANTDHQGIEASIDYRLAPRWYVGADATVARHRYGDDANLAGTSGNIDGNDIDTAPRHFGSARLGWDYSDRGNAELEWVYMGSYYLDPENAHKYDGHQLLNLRIASAIGRHWQAALRLTNLLDEDYAERADFGFGQYRYFVGQPRGAYVEIGYRP